MGDVKNVKENKIRKLEKIMTIKLNCTKLFRLEF